MTSRSKREELRRQKEREALRQRRRKIVLVVAAAVVVVAIVVAVVLGMQQKSRNERNGSGNELAQTLVSFPASAYDTVTTNGLTLSGEKTGEKAGGSKPSLLYIGGEFCPYCAMERLSLVAALARFGHFDGLSDTISSPNEGELSNIPTVTFHGSKYHSDYLDLKAIEVSDRQNRPLDELTQQERAKLMKYTQGAVPFLYWGDLHTTSPVMIPELAGMEKSEVIEQLKDPNSNVSKSVMGAANLFSAELCKRTNGKPANVCNAKGVRGAAGSLPK